MVFGTKAKSYILYGKGLAKTMYNNSKENVEICRDQGATFRGTFENYLKMYLNMEDGMLKI